MTNYEKKVAAPPTDDTLPESPVDCTRPLWCVVARTLSGPAKPADGMVAMSRGPSVLTWGRELRKVGTNFASHVIGAATPCNVDYDSEEGKNFLCGANLAFESQRGEIPS